MQEKYMLLDINKNIKMVLHPTLPNGALSNNECLGFTLEFPRVFYEFSDTYGIYVQKSL